MQSELIITITLEQVWSGKESILMLVVKLVEPLKEGGDYTLQKTYIWKEEYATIYINKAYHIT